MGDMFPCVFAFRTPLLKEVEEEERQYEQEMERWYDDQRRRITSYVNGLSAKEARSQLIEMLIDQENERSSHW